MMFRTDEFLFIIYNNFFFLLWKIIYFLIIVVLQVLGLLKWLHLI